MHFASTLKILAVSIALSAAVPASADEFTYHNKRFGTTASFPMEMFPYAFPPPPDGEGFAWHSSEGAELFIYGRKNANRDTPASLIRWREAYGDQITYKRTGRNWAVISGYRPDGKIFYERYIIRGSNIHSVSIRYPKEIRVVYDKLVGPITKSLRAS